jgi:hypothetical protein
MWLLRIFLTLPALIAAVVSHEALGPIATVVAVIFIIGFAVMAAGWTIRRDV